MAAQNPPYALQGATGIDHPAELFRRMLRTVTGGATGVVGSGDMLVTANGTPNMSVNVAKGEALVAGSASVDQGTYYCFNDATVNLAVSNSDLTNPRIDLVVAKVADTLSDADTWSLAVVAGTAAPSPAPPAAPVNSLVLAQIAVAAGAGSIVSGDITDKRPRASGPGSVLKYAEVTSGVSPLATASPGTTLASITVTVPSGRQVRVKGYVFLNSSVSGDTVYAGIFEGSTQLQSDQMAWDGNVNYTKAMKPERVLTPSAGTHTYLLTAWRHTGTGTVASVADATDPAFIYAEDVGPA